MPVFFPVLVVISVEAREKTLKRLANIKERDEREEFITGRAARGSYISTMRILILLLFLSVFQVQVERLPDNEIVDGKRNSFSIGLHFELIEDSASGAAPGRDTLFESRELPLSKPALILLVLIWQTASFTLRARKGINGDQ